jgi:hypothetical protein
MNPLGFLHRPPLIDRSAHRNRALSLSIVLIVAVVACSGERSIRDCTRNSDCASGLECRLDSCRPPLAPADGGDNGMTVDSGRPSVTDAGSGDDSGFTGDAGLAVDSGLAPDAGIAPDAGGVADAGVMSCAATGSCVFGQPCNSGADCKSQFCASGVCCDGPCGGGCETCKSAGAVGSCRPLPKGTACGAYACTGTSPQCPTQCAKPSDCASTSTCCLSGNDATSVECNVQNLANTCIQLPLCNSVKDDFQGPTLAPTVWSLTSSNANGTAGIVNGQLAFAWAHPAGSKNAYTAAVLRKRISLVGNSCQVEISDTSALAGSPKIALVGLVLVSPAGEGSFNLRINRDRTVVAEERYPPSAGLTNKYIESVPLDASARKFLRMTEDAGTVFFDYSGNGRDFTRLAASKTPIRTSDLTLNLAVYEEEVVRDAGVSIRLDNFNSVP